MSRLISTIKFDLLLQKRYGIVIAAGFIVIFWVFLLMQIPNNFHKTALPLLIFLDLGMVGFYFIAALLLFEKGEETLSALVVTPLRFSEYITSKLVTLTLLSIGISLIVVYSSTTAFNLYLLLLGVVTTSVLFTLIGFIAVSPFSSLSNFLIPSQFVLLPLQLPLIKYLGYETNLLLLLPSQGSLLLLQSAFEAIAPWQITYAIVYQLIWIILLLILAKRAFNRYVIG